LTRTLLAIGVAGWLAGGLVATLRAAQPPATTPPSTVDEDLKKQTKELKLKALDAEKAHDSKKALDLYEQILRIDPDDLTARLQKKEAEAAIEREKSKAVDSFDKVAQQTGGRRELDAAEAALVEAIRTGGSLAGAQESLDKARRLLPGDPSVDPLQRRIDQEISARRWRFWELWGGVGLGVLALAGAMAFYFYRTGRTLEVIEGPQIGQVFVLKNESTVLGALASEVDWAIEDPLRKISRRHCDVLRQGRHYFVVDRSLNGTFLNGRALAKDQPSLLKRGDRIGLGGEVTLRFR
jgi:hypothetical protein